MLSHVYDYVQHNYIVEVVSQHIPVNDINQSTCLWFWTMISSLVHNMTFLLTPSPVELVFIKTGKKYDGQYIDNYRPVLPKVLLQVYLYKPRRF